VDDMVVAVGSSLVAAYIEFWNRLLNLLLI